MKLQKMVSRNERLENVFAAAKRHPPRNDFYRDNLPLGTLPGKKQQLRFLFMCHPLKWNCCDDTARRVMTVLGWHWLTTGAVLNYDRRMAILKFLTRKSYQFEFYIQRVFTRTNHPYTAAQPHNSIQQIFTKFPSMGKIRKI
jgi:hypothetical protein